MALTLPGLHEWILFVVCRTNPHPHIVQFMGACTIPGKFAIVMELLDGNLESLLLSEEGSKIRLYERLVMAKEAALGMNRLHKTEPAIIHRDFKLENLMVRATKPTARMVLLTLMATLPPVVQENRSDLYHESGRLRSRGDQAQGQEDDSCRSAWHSADPCS